MKPKKSLDETLRRKHLTTAYIIIRINHFPTANMKLEIYLQSTKASNQRQKEYNLYNSLNLKKWFENFQWNYFETSRLYIDSTVAIFHCEIYIIKSFANRQQFPARQLELVMSVSRYFTKIHYAILHSRSNILWKADVSFWDALYKECFQQIKTSHLPK